MKENFNGKYFGKLQVISDKFYIRNGKNNRAHYTCKCECGVILNIREDQLIQKRVSCGCVRLTPNYYAELGRINHPRITSAKQVYVKYKKGTLTFEDFCTLTQKDCFYCGAKPGKSFNTFLYMKYRKQEYKPSEYSIANGVFTYNGLDRIDSSKTYSLDNVVPCCTQCNIAKNVVHQEDFIKWIFKVAKNIELTKPEFMPSSL